MDGKDLGKYLVKKEANSKTTELKKGKSLKRRKIGNRKMVKRGNV